MGKEAWEVGSVAFFDWRMQRSRRQTARLHEAVALLFCCCITFVYSPTVNLFLLYNGSGGNVSTLFALVLKTGLLAHICNTGTNKSDPGRPQVLGQLGSKWQKPGVLVFLFCFETETHCVAPTEPELQ